MSDAAIDFCWSRIGIGGDGSCPELARVVHCRNCEVFARAGRGLLAQPPPAEYLEHWAGRLAVAPLEDEAATVSTVVFRLARERLALPTTAFVEAVTVRPVHRIPHRSSGVLLGLANVRGELHLCASLAALLGIDASDEPPPGRPRFAVVEQDAERWVFPVDELLGVHRIARHGLAAPPATVTHDAGALTSALFELDGARVALLDPELLIARLRRLTA